MGDDTIEEIYALAKKSPGQIRVDIFPYRMEPETHAKAIEQHPEFEDFWTNELLPAYIKFTETKLPPPFEISTKGAYIHLD